jgi:hypothetical protein
MCWSGSWGRTISGYGKPEWKFLFQGAILKNKAAVLIPLAAAIMLSQTALAGSVDVDFSFTGPGGISGSGVFTVMTTADPTINDITGITGTFLDPGDGVSGPISGLVPSAYSNVCPGAANFSPAGYSFDNLFYPSGSPAICAFDYPFSGGVLDIFGVLFNVNDAGTTYTVDLWSNGVLPGTGLGYGISVAEGADTINDGVGGNGVNLSSFTPIPAPEPGNLFVVGIGLVGLIACTRRRLTRLSSSCVAFADSDNWPLNRNRTRG